MISKNCDILCKLLLTIRKISGGPIHGGPTHGRILLLDMEVSSASVTFVKKCEHSNDCQLLPHSDQHLSPPRCPCPRSPWGGFHPSLLDKLLEQKQWRAGSLLLSYHPVSGFRFPRNFRAKRLLIDFNIIPANYLAENW